VSVDFFLDYRSEPVDIVAVMRKVNNQPSPLCPPKARYAGIDAQRWAEHYDVVFRAGLSGSATLASYRLC
jgi:hypothetical protein